MKARAKKVLLLLLAAALLAVSGQMQKSINRDRVQLGLTIGEPLQDAPPLLAFTTVALGGFRGLISNYLWIRADDLQLDDKYFEAAQLADWITDLEPHFAQVWVFQAWNMAFNISVKFEDFSDRWHWVQRGIQLLRDRALLYNPNDPVIYQYLAWFFQFKMGQNLDDANMYYKQQWAEAMTPFFGANGTNFENLIHPQTAEARTNALVLREKYKIDPVFAQKVDAECGPLDWRLPEAHAIYWYAVGLEKARENPGKVKQDDLSTLRRGIYQSLLQAFRHGRIITNPFTDGVELAPKFDLIPRVNDAFTNAYVEETQPAYKDGDLIAHRNFLRDAIYFLYEDNRMAEANKWFQYLGEKYPDKPIIDKQPDSLPKNLTLDQYAVAVVQIDIGETSQERVTAAVQGLLRHAYMDLAIGQDDRYENMKRLAARVYQRYTASTAEYKGNVRIPLPPYDVLNRTVLNDLLDTQKPALPYFARAGIRSYLGMSAETNAPAVTSTNLPPVSTTNAVENALTNSPGK